MQIELVAIGDELLDGRLADSNGRRLAQYLGGFGLRLSRISVVSDDVAAIVAALKSAASRAHLVVTTGGLGPTSDDLTADAVAAAAGVGTTIDAAALEAVRAVFIRRGMQMPASNRRQAEVPDGARVIPNPVGTAPGFVVPVDSVPVASFPGVPREFQAMLEAGIAPVLETHGARVPTFGETLRFFGTTESGLADVIEPILAAHAVRVQYRASFPEVLLSLRGADADAVQEAVAAVHAAAGRHVWATGTDDVYARLVHLGTQAKVAIGAAESCTGGLLGQRITNVPGASATFLGSVVAYGNRVKHALLDVPSHTLSTYGAVSEETAGAMAAGARERLGVDFAVSITGIAGPGGGSPEKPVGHVCFGCASPAGVEVRTKQFGALGRDRVRDLASFYAARWMLKAVARAHEAEGACAFFK